MAAENSDEVESVALQLRLSLQRMLKGRSSFREAFQLTTDRIESLVLMARDLAEQGKFDEAVTLLSGLVVVDPDNALVHSCLGAIFMVQNLRVSARRELSYALKLDPNDITARANLGELCFEQGDLPAALEHLKHAVTLDPDGVNASANRARSLLQLIANAAKEIQAEGPQSGTELKRKILELRLQRSGI